MKTVCMEVAYYQKGKQFSLVNDEGYLDLREIIQVIIYPLILF